MEQASERKREKETKDCERSNRVRRAEWGAKERGRRRRTRRREGVWTCTNSDVTAGQGRLTLVLQHTTNFLSSAPVRVLYCCWSPVAVRSGAGLQWRDALVLVSSGGSFWYCFQGEGLTGARLQCKLYFAAGLHWRVALQLVTSEGSCWCLSPESSRTGL